MALPLNISLAFLLVAASAELVAASGDLRLADAIKRADSQALRQLLEEPQIAVNERLADGASALHLAVHLNDREAVSLLLGAGADANAANDYGITPLSLACTNGNPALVNMLLQAGADANAVLPSGETVLMTCSRAGTAEAVRSLLAYGAHVDARENEKGQTALMWAVAQKHADVARLLIQHGADIQATSKAGFTPMLFAARVGDVESARVLLEGGADVNEAVALQQAGAARDPYGSAPAQDRQIQEPAGTMTPLLMAAASGHEEAAIFLLENGADANAADSYGATALHYSMLKGLASMNGVSLANYVFYLFRPNMSELVKALLGKGADPNARLTKGVPVGGGRGADAAGATPLLVAAASGDPYIMRILSEAGADPLATTDGDLTALMAAAGVGRVQDFTDAEERDALEAVKLAVQLGVDVNAQNEKGRTALHGATNLGGDSIIQFLAEAGADLNVRDQWQQTPLSIASGVHLPWTPKGEELGEVVREESTALLLSLGATPLTAPDYFVPMDVDSDVYRMNPRRAIPGSVAGD